MQMAVGLLKKQIYDQMVVRQGVEYIEQPLEEGKEFDLQYLYTNRPMPIYIDESCRYSQDVCKLADYIDGVNMKLMKCGGITEALLLMKKAQKYKLKTMIGCMSESSVSIAAAASFLVGLIKLIWILIIIYLLTPPQGSRW